MRSKLPAGIIAVVACLVALAPAQMGPSIGDSVAHPWYSGVQTNSTLIRVPMGDHVVSVPGTPWVRLFFSDITLGPDDRIVITGVLDGVSQTLDAINVKRWSSTSAYFNGDTVQVQLLVAPASTASYEITRVAHGFAVSGATESICGAVDNRTPSTEQEVCRILTAANSSTAYGTGFIIDSSGCMLTAGHVAAAWGIAPVAEFNVPFSSASGAVNHPAPQDQYPIDTLSLIMVNGVIGDDWAVAKVFNDPAASQGFMTLAAALPAVNTTTRITGNGTDTTPNSTYNGIQQTDTGPLTAISGFELRYRIDTTGGNSGSPVRVNSSNLVYGIHTNGGCTATGGFNSGTSIFNTGLQAAIGTVCGGAPSCQPLTLATGSQNSTCSPVAANFTLGAAAWNAIGVSSVGDWDITGGGASSTMAGSACDYIIHDGRAGFSNVGSAIATRAAGTASADLQHAARIWATLGSTTSFPWPQDEILRVIELNITTTGNYDFTISGLNLEWSLFSPASNVWMTRAAAMVTATVGGGTVTVPGLTPGVYAVVISRDGGAGTPLPNVSVNISSGAPTCPASISSPAQGYSLDCGTQLTRQWTVTSAGSLSGGSWSLPCTGGNLPASWLTFVGTPTATTADVRVTVPPCTPAGVYSCPTGIQWTGTCLGVTSTTLTAPIAVTVAACPAAGGPGASPTANPNPVCAGQSAVFAANAQNATSYSWTFPGGTPSTSSSQNPTVMFANPGTYTCTLSMNGSCAGTSGTAQVTVIVGPAMNVAAISPATGDVTGGTFVTITGSGFGDDPSLGDPKCGGRALCCRVSRVGRRRCQPRCRRRRRRPRSLPPSVTRG